MTRLPLLLLLSLVFARLVSAADGKVIKVLPHLLDQAGRHSLSPSLFERDAYQAVLRKHPEKVSGLRYDVCWRVRGGDKSKLKLRLQLRTARGDPTAPLVLEAPVKARFGSGGWASVTLDGETYRRSGQVQAWRATLLEGDTEIAEQKSFLW